ncbi:hypothetical protein [Haloferax sp. DFSO60]|uniref:hypothetical protein n=1 Tax=Haloferax sp. DFSO60 TaxID=3388652 RepID=UPI003979BA05
MRSSGEHPRALQPAMNVPLYRSDPEAESEAKMRRLALALKLLKLALGVVAAALSIAKLLGAL